MGRRSKTGCITCRIRRVKCDETKPECTKCTNSDRKCDGYLEDENYIPRRGLVKAVRDIATVGPASQALASNYQIISRRPSPSWSPPHARQDSALFDFFRLNTGPSTSSFLPSDFWIREALQLALTEPAIWHAAVAVGALHWKRNLESASDDGDAEAQRLTHRAHFHHGKALSLVKDLSSSSKFLALAVILMASANLMGNLYEAQHHALEALRSAGELRTKPYAEPEVESLTAMLSRLDVQAMTFSDSASPYPYVQAIKLHRPESLVDIEARRNIDSYSQAAATLYPMIKRAMLLDEMLGLQKDCGDYILNVGSLHKDLTDWESSMATFEASLAPEARQITPALSLRLWHTILRLFAKATFVGNEERWDACLAYFERIVLLAEVVASRLYDTTKTRLTLEPGLIVPLFLTAHRCRQPMLRRRAVALLQKLNSQEGMWRSDAAAMVAQAIIYIEEGLWTDQDLRNSRHSFESITPTGIHGGIWLERLVAVPWQSSSTYPLQVLDTQEHFTPAMVEERIGDVLILAHFHIRRLKLTFAMASPDPSFAYSGRKWLEITY